jgi:hypothetical protein
MKILMLLVAVPLLAADPPGFTTYTSADLQSRAKATARPKCMIRRWTWSP